MSTEDEEFTEEEESLGERMDDWVPQLLEPEDDEAA